MSESDKTGVWWRNRPDCSVNRRLAGELSCLVQGKANQGELGRLSQLCRRRAKQKRKRGEARPSSGAAARPGPNQPKPAGVPRGRYALGRAHSALLPRPSLRSAASTASCGDVPTLRPAQSQGWSAPSRFTQPRPYRPGLPTLWTSPKRWNQAPTQGLSGHDESRTQVSDVE